jgi:trigger factor
LTWRFESSHPHSNSFEQSEERIEVKTTLSERDGNTVKFAVEVSSEELQEAFNTHLKKLSREVRIPGFRPGKAPVAMVRQRLGDEYVLTETVEESMAGWYAQAVIELGLEPVDRPEVDAGEDVPELGKPVSFTAAVTVMPDLVLGEYKGLEVPKESSEVQDSEVDSQMERLQNEMAELRPVSDRAAQMGDFVTVDFHATSDGKPVEDLAADDYVFEVGGDRMFPGVAENLVGMSAGEERTFPFPVPEGFPGDAAGKTVDFVLSLKEIKEKVLPPLTDQWASEVSEFATLLELRLEIRGKIAGGKAYAVEQQFRANAVKKAVDNAGIELPEVVVLAEAEELLADFKSSIEQQGGTLEGYVEAMGVTAQAMLEDIKPQAANNVKTKLTLDAVAAEEGLDVTDEEVGAVVAHMAVSGKVDAKVLENRLRKSGRLENLKGQLIRDKAIDFIVKSAVAVAPEAKPAAAKKTAKATTASKAPAKSGAKAAGAAKKPAKTAKAPEAEASEVSAVEAPAAEAPAAEEAEAGE